MKRAVVAAFGWPANRLEGAVYPYTEVDNTEERLDGASNYTLTFQKGLTPPTDRLLVRGGYPFCGYYLHPRCQ